jgi:phage-related protein
MFKKIEAIDNKLKAFAGVKVFQAVGNAVKGALDEYDKFQASLNGESNFTKQFDRVKTAMAGTLGTMRDSLIGVVGDIAGKDGFKALEETIPKIGAALIGAFSVAKEIVINIKNNFGELLKPKAWNDFFTHAKNLATSFASFLGNVLIDAFNYSLAVFKWGFTDLNLSQLLSNSLNMFAKDFYDFMAFIGKPIKGVEEFMKGKAAEAEARMFKRDPAPTFSSSDKTKEAAGSLGNELKKSFGSVFDALAGRNVSEIYNEAQKEALGKLTATITAMQEDRTGEQLNATLRELKDSLSKQGNTAASEAGGGYSKAASYITGLLGSATEEQAQKVRDKMEGLNRQFSAATEKLQGLFEELENAKDAKAAESVFGKINAQVKNINGLSDSMYKLDKIIEGTEKKFASLGEKLGAWLGEKLGAALGGAGNLLGQALGNIANLFGDASTAINAIFTGNPLGLIITLISKLFEVFSKISGPFAAFMNIFDVLFDAIEEIVVVLGPALDAIFKPIVDIVRQLGLVFGVFLVALTPVFDLIGLLAQALTLLSPVLYGIGVIFAALADGFAHVYNAVSGIVKSITFGLVNMGRKDTNNIQRFEESWNATKEYDEYSNSNNSTSYSVAGDMYININFSHSYVNGDSREIALMLRDEIRLAEKSGY